MYHGAHPHPLPRHRGGTGGGGGGGDGGGNAVGGLLLPPPPPLSEAVAASAFTIRATVTAAVFIPDPLEEQGKDKVYAATVRRSFKGCLPRRIELVSGANSALCGVTLQVGTTYLFVLRAADGAGKYRVSSCDTLRVWSEVSWADRKTLAGANNLVCPRSPWVFGPYAYKK